MLIKIPYKLTHDYCQEFIYKNVLIPILRENINSFILDFSSITFIDPSGVAALYNSMRVFSYHEADVSFINHDIQTKVNLYLDDCEFFLHFLNIRVFRGRGTRNTTVPIHIFDVNNYYGHLNGKLIPWIALSLNTCPKYLEVLRATLEEAYHNVSYHSGVKEGCVFAQHFPKKKELEIVISDHGKGIPTLVKSKIPNISDHDALKKAFEKGFTTGSVVQNRGWGLWQLANFTAQKNGGLVTISSGFGIATGTRGVSDPIIKVRSLKYSYPGTLVRVVLKTDILEQLNYDTEEEVFEW